MAESPSKVPDKCSDSSGSLTSSPCRPGLNAKPTLSGFMREQSSPSTPPETPGLKPKGKLSMGLLKPKINVNVENDYDDLESPLEKRGLKTDINKHENQLQVISDGSTPNQSADLFSED